MKRKVAILDYGLGNLFSIYQACEFVGLSPIITSNSNEINNSDGLILPGVGAFGDAMKNLNENDLIIPIINFAKSGKPFLGICLGMQLLFSESEEFGINKGLDLIKGQIKKFPVKNEIGEKNLVPQIQWNQIFKSNSKGWENSALMNNNEGDYMYFVHSYFAIPSNKLDMLSYTIYADTKYASSVKRDNITGIQFHPEKSSKQGLQIYKTWSEQL